MPAPVYATAADLALELSAETFALVDPDEVGRLLRRASERVRSRIIQPIDVDDEVQVDGLMRATCAVVEQWVEVGEENDIDGLAGTQVSVNGYSGTRPALLCPRAEQALTEVGLGYRGVTA